MIKKTSTQISFGFSSFLEGQPNPKHPIFRLSKEIQWRVFDQEFSKHYSAKKGKPSKPIRLMVSLLILKQLGNIGRKLTADRFGK